MVILYYHDRFNAQHRIPLGNYTMNDAQALINRAIDRRQSVSFKLQEYKHLLVPEQVKRIILVEEYFEQEVLGQVEIVELDFLPDGYDTETDDEDDEDEDEDTDPQEAP